MVKINVAGFDVPNSPDDQNQVTTMSTLEMKMKGENHPATSHLQYTLLNHPTNSDPCASLPPQQNVTLNHLYIENREPPRSVVALGVTHRYQSKFVTVVLYKPVPRR